MFPREWRKANMDQLKNLTHNQNKWLIAWTEHIKECNAILWNNDEIRTREIKTHIDGILNLLPKMAESIEPLESYTVGGSKVVRKEVPQ